MDINEKVEANPKTTIKAKVVQAIKWLQAMDNDDSEKIVKQAAQEQSANKNLMKRL